MDTATPSPAPIAPPKKGSGKKWWCLGCSGCFVLTLMGVLGIFGIMVIAFNAMKMDPVYKTALSLARDNPEIQAKMGTPITDSWWVGGSVTTENGAGSADLSFEISGPLQGGTVSVAATKGAHPGAVWNYTKLEVLLEDGTRVDLMNAP